MLLEKITSFESRHDGCVGEFTVLMRFRNRNKCKVRESDKEIKFGAKLSRPYRAKKFC